MILKEILELLPYQENWNPLLYKEYSGLYEEHKAELEDCLQAAGVREKFNKRFTKWIARSLNAPSLNPVSAAELDEMDLPPIEWIVNDLLPVGINILAAPPKSYKSFMALQLCIAVCQGGTFLNRQCIKASCLYYDLESGKRRPRDRMRLMMGSKEKKPDNLYFITIGEKVGQIGQGFEQQLREMIDIHPDIRLVVVDVFQKVRKAPRRSDTGYDRDYGDIAPLAEICSQLNICILLLHHTRKMKDTDKFNEISGSIGMLGSVDTAFVIERETREDNKSILHITGRDVEPQELSVFFDSSQFLWKYRGTAQEIADSKRVEEYNSSPITETIRKVVSANNGTWSGTAKEVKKAAKYFNLEIYENEQHIGRFISEHEGELWGLDRIRVGSQRKADRRTITFTKADI